MMRNKLFVLLPRRDEVVRYGVEHLPIYLRLR